MSLVRECHSALYGAFYSTRGMGCLNCFSKLKGRIQTIRSPPVAVCTSGKHSLSVRLTTSVIRDNNILQTLLQGVMMILRNGDAYAVEYFADEMHGFGVYRFANEHRYKAAWHEGRIEDEVLDNGVSLFPFLKILSQAGSSSTTISHAKVLKSVQVTGYDLFFHEARCIAEKAVVIADMDERVNIAVTAANRVANAARVVAVKAVQNEIHDVIDGRLLENVRFSCVCLGK
ncbi:MORN motif-containing protein [Artemisia annua]|uniref:MORN motif-containing protein n=1 Tax=Artemisia annua TaxID=35608 RepID=A0A2U1L972_ARTAN|nr:MORN motif-containing protein [Artemisia annua]